MQNNFHMSAEEFRKWGKHLIDWIADYYLNVEKYPVLSKSKPGDIRNQLPPSPPKCGENFSDILEDFNKIILPGITHWQSPNFYAFFPSNTSGPSILGELLSAGIGVQGMLWLTSPACTELETHVLDWIVELLDLPSFFKSTESGGGVIQDSASSGALCALIAAREKITHLQSNLHGVKEKLVLYCSSQTHSSIEKAAKIAGIGSANLRQIEIDSNFALAVRALKKQIKEDKENGYIPFFVCTNIGTTSSNAIDPIRQIGDICQRENIWLHVDAAMSGSAAVCPEYRFVNDGVELCDSYCFNPHKWLFTNFDCSCFFVKNKDDLIHALSILPEYLRNQATNSGEVIDYRDWQIPLGRRFRSLKLWFVIRHYGVDGLQFHIRKHIRIAQKLKMWIEENPSFELMAPTLLNLVCFRHLKGDSFNEQILNTLNNSGKMYLTHTKLSGKFTLRLCVGNATTTESHVLQAWQCLCELANQLEEKINE